MEREEILKNYILMKYKSVRQFALENNLKYSTVVAILTRGLGNAGIDNVFEICDALNISADYLINKSSIVEKPNSRKHTYSRSVEAYALLAKILQNEKKFTIDKIPLTEEETKLFNAGLMALIETIRILRKDSEKIEKESEE